MAACKGSAACVRFETRRLAGAVNCLLPITDAVLTPQGTWTGAANPCIQQFVVPEIIIKCQTRKYGSI
jgi:hypothetical protein